jgi:DNA polymerase III subunit gamma/tau
VSSVTLNLSRKWRSQDFSQIVGQDLAVRILKNSLYLGHYFPVYLFAGQRGCGKTSTARIFAAAINCHALTSFQKDPKKLSIPCLVCASCIAMRDGNHPDFIEIDAASHTGVDNIRSIIESSSLLPLMGRKRVYLIDEAHMLSKAAFNAALKILEEPPATALFMLATTNPHKIIDTVKSRCFQLFFTAIPHDPLKNHLSIICDKEKIACTQEALELIVRHTGGSARDALNLLEQVRFSSSVVSKESVLSLLGHIDDQQIMNLIQLTIQGGSIELVKLLQSLSIDQQKAEFIWQRMVILLRALLWIKHGVRPHELLSSVKLLEEYAKAYSLSDLHRIIEALYNHEELFLKTAMQNIFLEMVLLGLCNKKKTNNGDGSAPCALSVAPHNDFADDENEENQGDDIEDKEEEALSDKEKWQHFVTKIEKLNDPLISSVFKQARFIAYVDDTHHVSIELSKDFVLFKEWLDNSLSLWQPILREIFSSGAVLNAQFTGAQKTELIKKPKNDDVMQSSSTVQTTQIKPLQPSVAKALADKQKPPASSSSQYRPSNRYNAPKPSVSIAFNKNEVRIDVSDENIWKKSAILMRQFPGVVTEIRENQ